MQMEPVRIIIAPGGDTNFEVSWPVGTDLTGYYVEVFEPDPRLRSTVTASISGRTITARIGWDSRFPRDVPMHFSLRTRPTPTTGDWTSISFEAVVLAR